MKWKYQENLKRIPDEEENIYSKKVFVSPKRGNKHLYYGVLTIDH